MENAMAARAAISVLPHLPEIAALRWVVFIAVPAHPVEVAQVAPPIAPQAIRITIQVRSAALTVLPTIILARMAFLPQAVTPVALMWAIAERGLRSIESSFQ